MLLPSSRKPLLKPGAFSSNLSFQEKSLPNKQQYLLFQPSSCFSEETDRVHFIKKKLGRRSCSVEKGGVMRQEVELNKEEGRRKEGTRGERVIMGKKEKREAESRNKEEYAEEEKCHECADMKKSLKSLAYKYDCEKKKCSSIEAENTKLATVLEEERNKYEKKLTLFGEKITELKKLQNFYNNEKEKCQKLEKTLKDYIQKFEEIAISLINHDSLDELIQKIIEILQIVEINPKVKNLLVTIPIKNRKRKEEEDNLKRKQEEEEEKKKMNEEEETREQEENIKNNEKKKGIKEELEKKELQKRKEEESNKEKEDRKRKEEQTWNLREKKSLKRSGSQKENNLRLSNTNSFCSNPFRKDKSNIFFPLFPSPSSPLPSSSPLPFSSTSSSCDPPSFPPPSSSLPPSSMLPSLPSSSFPNIKSSSISPPSPSCREDDINYETFKSNIEVSTEGNQDFTLTFEVESDKENRGGVENEAQLSEGKKDEKGKKEENEFATAKYDYTPKKENDLSLKVGDHVQILKKTKNGWWIGMLNEKIGYFPYNYVE